MNKFESNFFEKYLSEGQMIKGIIHIHFIEIFNKLFLWISMGAIIPSFLYYYSDRVKELIPFMYLELFLIIVFIKIIYDIFDWYNDVWIVTEKGIVQLERSLFKTKTITVEYEKMEGLEVIQDGVIDKMVKKGDLLIHKFGDETLILENTINPYKAVDLIEEVSSEVEEEENQKTEHFDIIMDALGSVVENYLEKKANEVSDEDIIENEIKKISKKSGTINLR